MAEQQAVESQKPPQRGFRWHSGYEEVVVAALLLVGSVYFRLTVDNYIIGRQGSFLAPSFWPGALLTLGIVLSAIYLVMAVVRARRGPGDATHAEVRAHIPTGEAGIEGSPAPPAASAGESPDETGNVLKLVAGFVLVGAYIYLLGPIGFVPGTVLFTVAFLLLVGERRWWVLVAFPIGAVTVLLGMFTQLLTVSLPRGTGIFLDVSTYLY